MQRFTQFEQLNAALAAIHDCPFDLDKAVLDRATREWRGTFLRPLWEDPAAEHRRRALIVRESRLPLANLTLTVRGVTDVRLINDQEIGTYTFNKVARVPGGIRFAFNEALIIELVLEGPLEATYDERPVPGSYAVYREYLMFQTGPSIENVL